MNHTHRENAEAIAPRPGDAHKQRITEGSHRIAPRSTGDDPSHRSVPGNGERPTTLPLPTHSHNKTGLKLTNEYDTLGGIIQEHEKAPKSEHQSAAQPRAEPRHEQWRPAASSESTAEAAALGQSPKVLRCVPVPQT